MSTHTHYSFKFVNYLAADADYRTTTIMVTFMPSDLGTIQRLCGNVPIIDDTVANEPNEEFSVTLVSTDPSGARFGDKESCITIIDNDGEYIMACIVQVCQLQMP